MKSSALPSCLLICLLASCWGFVTSWTTTRLLLHEGSLTRLHAKQLEAGKGFEKEPSRKPLAFVPASKKALQEQSIEELEREMAVKFKTWKGDEEEEEEEGRGGVAKKDSRKQKKVFVDKNKKFSGFPRQREREAWPTEEEEEEEEEDYDLPRLEEDEDGGHVLDRLVMTQKPFSEVSFRLRKPPSPSPSSPPPPAPPAASSSKKREEEGKLFNKQSFAPFDFHDIAQQLAKNGSQQIFGEKTFEDLGIDDAVLLDNLEALGIYSPTRIQELAIDRLVQGRSVVLHAQTGSGKTLAFLLPFLRLLDAKQKKVQAVVLAPSRELVNQIGRVAKAVFEGTGLTSVTIIGGANLRNQISQIREKRPQIVIATPGRLAEIVFREEKLRLGNVRAVVIDEADGLLQPPYLDEIRTIVEAMPFLRRARSWQAATSQNEMDKEADGTAAESEEDADEPVKPTKPLLLCLASATAKNNPAVKDFANQYVGAGAWEEVAVPHANLLPASVTHGLISCARIKSLEMLKKLLHSQPEVQRALIFVNDPHRVQVVYEQLLDRGLLCAPLHGDSSKDDRKEVMARIRDGRLRLVVTTELAARGLDIPDLTHVINFELPTDAQHYLHRAGRCGRAGKPGLVINIATPSTKFVIRRFGKQLGAKILDCELREGKVFLRKP